MTKEKEAVLKKNLTKLFSIMIIVGLFLGGVTIFYYKYCTRMPNEEIIETEKVATVLLLNGAYELNTEISKDLDLKIEKNKITITSKYHRTVVTATMNGNDIEINTVHNNVGVIIAQIICGIMFGTCFTCVAIIIFFLIFFLIITLWEKLSKVKWK